MSTQSKLVDAIVEGKTEHFTPSAEVTFEKVLGVMLGHYAEWDGSKLARIFASALEDANFHTEAAEIENWIFSEKATK